MTDTRRGVMPLATIAPDTLHNLLQRYGLVLEMVTDEKIPGSFWGDSEAGLIENRLYVRADTPLHSLLHEACHYICMDGKRRANLHTNAGGDYAEENAVCYLQVLLADHLPPCNRQRMWQDMDAWGYSFRLGSARAWFEEDAEDARRWLLERRLVSPENLPTWRLRK